MKKIILSIVIPCISVVAFSQNEVDALRFTQNFAGGTARSMSMGGAFGALGADFSTLSTNPAGLGVYRKSEFVLSPAYYYKNIETRYYDKGNEDFITNFNMNNFGAVISSSLSGSNFVSVNFGIGYNRLNNFYGRTIINGYNTANSMADYFLDLAYGKDITELDDFREGLAFDSYVIDYDTTLGIYTTFVPFPPVDQRRLIETTGRINEWVFSIGTNYDERLFLGATLGVQSVRYNMTSQHEEFDPADESHLFTYNEDLQTYGTGFNLKLGLIYKPMDLLRLGLAVHTPTTLYLKDEYTTDMLVDSRRYYPLNSDYEISEYKVNTPFKLIGSVGLIIKKTALVSADIEVVDYSTIRLESRNRTSNFMDENDIVKQIYRTNINFKSGVEYRIGQLSLRGGFAYYGSPFIVDELNEKSYNLAYSGGIGLRDKNIYFDLGYQYMTNPYSFSIYSDNYVYTDNISHKVIATIGFRF